MEIKQKFVPDGLKNNPNKDMSEIKVITIHNTGNYAAGATAKMHADYQYTGSGGREASWHYTVDADEVWQSFDDKRMCWHAGDGKGQGNASSIGIEICVHDKAGFPKACENAAKLTAQLLHKHGLTIEQVVQHYDWSGKDCPAELRNGRWGVPWEYFIEVVRTAHRYMALIPQPAPVSHEPSAWAKASWDKAVARKIFDGTNPTSPPTREQLAVVLDRLGLLG